MMYVCELRHTHSTEPAWRPEDTAQESILSFHQVSSWVQSQVIRLDLASAYIS